MDGPDNEEFIVAFTDAGQVKNTQRIRRVLNSQFGERVEKLATRAYVRTESDKAGKQIFMRSCAWTFTIIAHF